MVTAEAGTFAFVAWVPWVVWRLHLCAHTVWGWRGSVGKAFGKLWSGRAKRCCLCVQVGLVRSVRFGFRSGQAGDKCFSNLLSVRKLSCGIRVLGAERVGLFPSCFLAYRLSRLGLWRRRGVFVCQDMKQASEQAICDYGN